MRASSIVTAARSSRPGVEQLGHGRERKRERHRDARDARTGAPLALLLEQQALLLEPSPLFLQAPHLAFEILCLDRFEQRVEARLQLVLVELQHSQARERREVGGQGVLRRRQRAPIRTGRTRSGGGRRGRCAQTERRRDLVAHPIVAAQPRLQHLGPARADDDEDDLGVVQRLVDRFDEVVAVADVVDVHEGIGELGAARELAVEQRGRDHAVVAAVAEEDAHPPLSCRQSGAPSAQCSGATSSPVIDREEARMIFEQVATGGCQIPQCAGAPSGFLARFLRSTRGIACRVFSRRRTGRRPSQNRARLP
jgi:hypothetical protein